MNLGIKKHILYAMVTMFFMITPATVCAQKHTDTDKLSRALEYFTSGKYHEALLIFQYLDKNYKLNPRFRAYIGLCLYYEWEYEKAVTYFEEVLPQLDGLAPHERSVYYYATAESYFNLSQYSKAIPYYERVINLCYSNEKGDVFYRLGFCYMFINDWENARDFFQSSLLYYQQYSNTAEIQPRLSQLEKMIQGCEKKCEKKSNDVVKPEQ